MSESKVKQLRQHKNLVADATPETPPPCPQERRDGAAAWTMAATTPPLEVSK